MKLIRKEITSVWHCNGHLNSIFDSYSLQPRLQPLDHGPTKKITLLEHKDKRQRQRLLVIIRHIYSHLSILYKFFSMSYWWRDASPVSTRHRFNVVTTLFGCPMRKQTTYEVPEVEPRSQNSYPTLPTIRPRIRTQKRR